jgi:exodeoxyribonuclease VII small subunit
MRRKREAMAETPTEIQALSYEDALKELEALIRKLESGSVDLADSIASYERGAALAAHCSKLLEATEQKVERLVLGADGKPSEEPLPSLDEDQS